jgi:hypothetical protein
MCARRRALAARRRRSGALAPLPRRPRRSLSTQTHTLNTCTHTKKMIAAMPVKPEDIKTTPFPLLVKDRGF